MHILRRAASNMLCCFGTHEHEDLQPPSIRRKTTANKDTPTSMSVHGASVPHALDSPEMLQKIFTSNASQRGYNAVQPAHSKFHAPQGSLDFNFRFGSEPSEKKPHGRLEQLTQHVKQKLSENRLSQADGTDARPIQRSNKLLHTVPDVSTRLLGRSQTSIGLTELLASRAVSEGGYDSDARSIQTPTILSGRDTFRRRTQTVRQSIAASGCSTDGKSYQLSSRAGMDEAPTLPGGEVSQSLVIPEAPRTMSFLEALNIDPCDLKSDDASHSDDEIALETIKLLSTTEPGASVLPLDIRTDAESELPTPVLRQSIKSLDEERDQTIHDRYQAAAPETNTELFGEVDVPLHGCIASTESNDSNTHPDLALVNQVEDSSRPHHDDQAITDSAFATADIVEPTEATNNVPTGVISMSEAKPKYSTKANASTAMSDQQSLHLFNMRISQRLASSSRIPMLSSTNISNELFNSSTSLAHPHMRHDRRTSSLSRGPTFINVEHNRCPSDPDTKRLFEHPSAYPSRNGKRSLSDGSVTASNLFPRKKEPIVDDSSSYYGSIMDGATSEPEIPIPPRSKARLVNTNSLAVGGRSVSGPVPRKVPAAHPYHITDLISDTRLKQGHPKSTSENKQDGNSHQAGVRARTSGASKPSKFIKIDSTPTPVARRFRSFTDANEAMSEIDTEDTLQNHVAVRGSESTQAFEDRRNEAFSEIETSMPTLRNAVQNDKAYTADAWLTQGRRTGWGFSFPERKARDNTEPLCLPNKDNPSNCNPVSDGQDNTSDVWRKAFRRIGGPDDRGNLLETPRFNREGRRKNSTMSASDNEMSTRKSSISSTVPRRSQSVDPNQHESMDPIELHKKRHRSFPVLKDFGLSIPHKRSYTLSRRSRLQKTSLADLGRRVITTGIVSNLSKPSKEGLGIWGRFASHSREQRNGPAGPMDEVKVQDFCNESDKSSPEQASTPVQKPNISLKLRSQGSWVFAHPVTKRQSTKSMALNLSSAERALHRRSGIVDRFKRLYRTRSSEIQMYTTTQGHRSSISTGLSPEYPELESLPGGGVPDKGYQRDEFLDCRMDGATEQDGEAFLDTISEVTSKRSKSMRSCTLPWRKADAEEWSKIYQDCIGSFSALKSDEDVPDTVQKAPESTPKRVLGSNAGLRESTVNFEAGLRETTLEAKESLLRQLQSSDEESGMGNRLRMPGSFV